MTGGNRRPRDRDRGIVGCDCRDRECPLISALARMVRDAIDSEQDASRPREETKVETAERS